MLIKKGLNTRILIGTEIINVPWKNIKIKYKTENISIVIHKIPYQTIRRLGSNGHIATNIKISKKTKNNIIECNIYVKYGYCMGYNRNSITFWGDDYKREFF